MHTSLLLTKLPTVRLIVLLFHLSINNHLWDTYQHPGSVHSMWGHGYNQEGQNLYPHGSYTSDEKRGHVKTLNKCLVIRHYL